MSKNSKNKNNHHHCNNLDIEFDNTWIVSGQNVTKEAAANEPDYCFDGNPQTGSYTLIMHDPDAPVAKAKGNSYLHWLIPNINGILARRSKDTIQSYMGPAPPPRTGVHHYIFSLLKQKADIDKKNIALLKAKYADRSEFNYEQFVDDLDLEPVEEAYFTVSS